MKYEFEIRGEFETQTRIKADYNKQRFIDFINDNLDGYGGVTSYQLALKGKLQKPTISDLAEEYDAAINAFMDEYERINKS